MQAYECLKVAPWVSDQSVTKSFRIRSLKVHPDKTGGVKNEDFLRLQTSRDIILTDPKRKQLSRDEEKRRRNIEMMCVIPKEHRESVSDDKEDALTLDECFGSNLYDESICFDGRAYEMGHQDSTCYLPKDYATREEVKMMERRLKFLVYNYPICEHIGTDPRILRETDIELDELKLSLESFYLYCSEEPTYCDAAKLARIRKRKLTKCQYIDIVNESV